MGRPRICFRKEFDAPKKLSASRVSRRFASSPGSAYVARFQVVMPDTAKSIFQVDTESDPVLLRIEGRACFQNSTCLRDFDASTRRGKTRFVVDFSQCAGMDSTFLGVLAGAALKLRALSPPGSLVLCRLSPRNLELLRNLGLHELLCVDAGPAPTDGSCSALEMQGRAQQVGERPLGRWRGAPPALRRRFLQSRPLSGRPRLPPKTRRARLSAAAMTTPRRAPSTKDG